MRLISVINMGLCYLLIIFLLRKIFVAPPFS